MTKCLFYVTTYNQSKWILDCIESLKRQTNPNWQAIVYNDASTDNTRRILSEVSDIRVMCVNGDKELGMPSKCLNYMFGLDIPAEYECKIDGDNELMPEWIEKMCVDECTYSSFRCLSLDDGVRWVKNDRFVEAEPYDAEKLLRQYYMGPSFVWPQEIRKRWNPLHGKPGRMDETWAEDWVVALLCQESGAFFRSLKERLFLYREYCGNASSRLLDTQAKCDALTALVSGMAKERRAR